MTWIQSQLLFYYYNVFIIQNHYFTENIGIHQINVLLCSTEYVN